MQPHVFVGLGNVGSSFETTRHNIGITALRAWVDSVSPELPRWQVKEQFKAELVMVSVSGVSVIALFPTTMMNTAGEAVQLYTAYHEIPIENVLIIHDDIELPAGDVRMVTSGSAKGHNGVRSIQSHLDTTDIARLRLGVGRPPEKMTTHDFVLGSFSTDEKTIVDQLIRDTATKLNERIETTK